MSSGVTSVGSSKAFRERFGIPNADDVFGDVGARIVNRNTLVQALKARVCRP